MANIDSSPIPAFVCAKCGKPLSDDGIEFTTGEVFDRACVTQEQVRADTDRRFPTSQVTA